MKKTLIFTLSLFLLISCKTKPKKEVHPILELIPGNELAYEGISKKETSSKIDSPEILKQLINTLGNQNFESELMLEGLNLNANVKLLSLKNNRLIFLDLDDDILLEYNVEKKEQTILASRGRGPGDIFLSSDLHLVNDTLIISNRDMRILKFNCNMIPCEYIDLFQLNSIVPLSITSNGKSFIALGNNKLPPQKKAISSDLIETSALWVINTEGNITKSFGKHYDIQNHWMLQRPFSEGIVEFSEKKKLYFLAFERLPFIYVFNKNFEQVTVLKIEEFILGKQEYDTGKGKLSVVQGDFSIISNIKNVTDDSFLIEVKTRKNRRIVDKIYQWDSNIDYYIINLTDFKSTYIGSNDSSSQYFVTKEMLLKRNSSNQFSLIR